MQANHIFVFFECYTLGGVERSALRYMREWVDVGRRVTLFIGADEGPLKAELPPSVDVLYGNAHSYPAMFAPTIAAIRRVRPDLVFVPGNHYTSIALAAWLALGRRCPPMVVKLSNAYVRSDHSRLRAWGYRQFVRWLRPAVGHFTALSRAMREEAIAVAGLDPARVSVIADPVIAGAAVPVGDAGPVIVAVARMVAQKRLERLVQAFAAIPAHIGARLEIVGDGPEQAKVEAAVAASGVAERITLHGYVADPSPLIARARVLALSSAYEGLPAVVLEAFAVGTPVVTTASSTSLGELIDDPRLGTIVPVDDLAGLSAAMAARVAQVPDRAWIMARAGGGAWPEAAAVYLDVFDRLVREREASGSRAPSALQLATVGRERTASRYSASGRIRSAAGGSRLHIRSRL